MLFLVYMLKNRKFSELSCCICIGLGILISLLGQVDGHLLKRGASLMNEDATVRTEIVDRNNRTILARFNLTVAQMNSIMQSQNPNNEDRADQDDTQRFHVIKEFRINDIKNRLQSAFQASNSDENQGHPLHEMAAYPICNSESTESSWLHDNNVTIRFSDSLFEPKRENLNLDSAILRLYKVNPNGTDEPNEPTDDGDKSVKSCGDPLTLTPQIRVTVSIVQQLRRNKRERKKHICNTTMMNISKTGWVEIDIKRAIYIWESVERQQQQSRQQPIQIGWLMIEVHDEEENPLKPGLFFNPPKCDQAEFAIPWNYYGPHTSLSPFAAHEVPRYPRLDVKLVGYASFAPKNIRKEVHDKLRGNLRRQLFNHSKSSAEDILTSEPPTLTTVATPTIENLLELSATIQTEPQHSAKKRQSEHNIEHQYFRRTHHSHNHRNHKRNLHENINEQGKHLTNAKQMIYRESVQPHNVRQRLRLPNRHNSHRRNHQPHQQHPTSPSTNSSTH
ncbi:protein anachronism [Anastrepha obliqua]|uniref:protein anachronism n=1 Tax=Anastrepha obliqua TaxID=95512 RepID=UPI0024098D8C|nr:protein anachronism [Anastrepha obliqua]